LRCKGDVCSKRAYIVVAEIKKRSKSAKKLKSPIKVRILSITKHNVKYFCKRLRGIIFTAVDTRCSIYFVWRIIRKRCWNLSGASLPKRLASSTFSDRAGPLD
jgi:hypothetical protein